MSLEIAIKDNAAGVDEVGRGPLIGPVVAAAVILPADCSLILCDSKKLSEKKRIVLAEEIKKQAIAYAYGQAVAAEIDEINIHHATLLAMSRAIHALPIKPSEVLVDGRFCPPDIPYDATAIVKGDGLVNCISAASILAKVHRDNWMIEYDKKVPQYGFASHKGYPTKAHLEAIQNHGLLPEHRRSFKPISYFEGQQA